MNIFQNMKISFKLFTGFSLVCFILAATILITMTYVKKVEEKSGLAIEVHAPTAKLSVELQNGLNASLANLRGYMLLGKEQFKTNRAHVWNERINSALERMTVLSQHWTETTNKEKLVKIKELFAKLRTVQDEIEQISGTPENLPAQKILLEQATPQATIMSKEITAMIDEEQTLEATPERKALLGMMADVRGTLGLGLANIRAYLLTGEETFRTNFETLWAKNTKRFEDLRQQTSFLTSTQIEAFKRFSEARGIFAPLPPQMFEIRSRAEWNLANHWLGTKAAPLAADIDAILSEMIDSQQKLMDTAFEVGKNSIATLTYLLWILLGAGLGLSAVIALVVTRSISKPLGKITETAQHIARGDLSQTVDIVQKDEIGLLAHAFRSLMEYIKGIARAADLLSEGDLTVQIIAKSEQDVLSQSFLRMKENLQQMVTNIREGSFTISSAASQVAQGNSDLSQRTQEQASALEETASSIEEMTSTVKQNADNARQANQLAVGARELAEKGGDVANKAVGAMAEINTSSKKIADIIGVIDSIAFQTNLLALNAAVEAARAGEQGRGFAVVAAEVRKLAQRSADAAKEIKTLISDSVEKVADGTKLVDESGKALEEIVQSVKKVSDIVAEIAAACQEQALGIEQVNKAVMQMDEVTQQNAALVEEMASASESMDAQAQELNKLMAFFKITEQKEHGQNLFSRSHKLHSEDTQQPVKRSQTQEHQDKGGQQALAAVSAVGTNGRSPVRTGRSSTDEDEEWSEF